MGKKIDEIKEIDLSPFDDFEYENFKLIDMYSDYGDITGIQIIRRFILHCNKHFGQLNESIKEFIRLYTDLSEMMAEHEAFIAAWNEMVEQNEKFVKEVKDLLELWIDDPRVQKWITDRLDKMIEEELPHKLDIKDFNVFIENQQKKDNMQDKEISKIDSKTDKKQVNQKRGKVLNFAHRGASLIAQENSLHAFDLAGAAGFDGIEFDIQTCKTGEWVVIHDATIDRTTNGSGRVSEMTLSEIKRHILWGGKNHLRNRNETVPTLEEVLGVAVKHNLKMLIEIKFKHTQKDIDLLINILEKYGVLNNVVVMSFYKENLEKLKKYEIKTGLVVGEMTKEHIDYMSQSFYYPYITFQYDVNNSDLFDYAKTRGVKIGVYTINKHNQIMRYKRKDFDFVTGGLLV